MRLFLALSLSLCLPIVIQLNIERRLPPRQRTTTVNNITLLSNFSYISVRPSPLLSSFGIRTLPLMLYHLSLSLSLCLCLCLSLSLFLFLTSLSHSLQYLWRSLSLFIYPLALLFTVPICSISSFCTD